MLTKVKISLFLLNLLLVRGARPQLSWSRDTQELVLSCNKTLPSSDLRMAVKGLKIKNIQKLKVIQCSPSKEFLQELLLMTNSEVDIGVLVLEDIDNYTWVGWEELRRVSYLEIVGSDAVHVKAERFKNLNKLETVVLRENTNTTIEEGSFSNLDNIKIIEISNCKLYELKENTFEKLIKLLKLDLHSNHLSSFPQGIFKDLENVEEINLSLNRLDSLPAGLFSNLRNLQRLNLMHNLLTKIDRNIFQPTQRLSHLYLQENQLKRINLALLGQRNSVLTNLDLSHNYLVSADIGPGIFGKLVSINMSHNKIKGRISGTLRINCGALKHINLSYNNFNGTIKKKDLDVFKRNISINLEHNNIKRIDMRPPRFKIGRYMRAPSPYNTVVRLQGNPMECDCFASELKERLVLDEEPSPPGLVFTDFLCGGLASLASTLYQDLVCVVPGQDYPSPTCPHPCSCSYNRHTSRAVLECSGANLTQVPGVLPLVKGARSIALHLARNQIHSIGEELDRVPGMAMVDYMDLSGNKIESVDHRHLPASLATLLLSNNSITSYSLDTVRYFEERNLSLELAHNPYPCSCTSSHLHSFLRTVGSLVRDSSDISILCSDRLCYPVPAYTIVIPILLIAMVATLLCYYHRTPITIWLYSHHWAAPLFPAEASTRAKDYDAFLSYSHQDAEFVEQVLYPGLASPADPALPAYRVCMHTLHWEVGRLIPDQIVESVASSSRTVIVLSKGYIESVWTKLEFKAAHRQALEDGAQVLILY